MKTATSRQPWILACVVGAAFAGFAGCSKDASDDDSDSDSGSSKASLIEVGSDARGACYRSALLAHGLYSNQVLAALGSAHGVVYVSARASADGWDLSWFGPAASEIARCRGL